MANTLPATEAVVPPAAKPVVSLTNTCVNPTPPANKRMAHIHKLERKHSSGDLHSRLKTRKLLGVGETDDGDVHRSKLSQILGHSDQLYVRLPWGLRIWQCVLAVTFSLFALWALVFPGNLNEMLFGTSETHESLLPVRLYGIAILCISLVYWSTLQSSDREIIRMILLVSMVYFGLQTIMIILTGLFSGFSDCFFTMFSGSGAILGVSSVYYWAIGGRLISIRSTTNKEVNTPSPQPVPSPSKDPNEKEHIN